MIRTPRTRDAAAGYGELMLVEQPAIALLELLGWTHANLFAETFGEHGSMGRDSERQVILTRRLGAALRHLNPGLPETAYAQAIEQFTQDRSKQLAVNANRDIYRLLKDGVKVSLPDAHGGHALETLRVIDWTEPGNNEFFRASGSTGCGSTHSITEGPGQEGAPILAAQAAGSVPSWGGCTGIPCPRTREDLYADRAGGAPSERWPIRGADLGAAAPRRTTRGISGVPVADPAMVRIRPPAAGGPAGSPAPRRIRVRAGTAAGPRFRRPRQ